LSGSAVDDGKLRSLKPAVTSVACARLYRVFDMVAKRGGVGNIWPGKAAPDAGSCAPMRIITSAPSTLILPRPKRVEQHHQLARLDGRQQVVNGGKGAGVVLKRGPHAVRFASECKCSREMKPVAT
jgi:hypothetical protein